MVYATLVQAVLIYVSETWVIFPRIGKTLGGFHHRVVRILTGRHPKRRLYGTWYYPPTGEGNDGGVHIVGGDIRNLPLEHSRTIYCDKAHCGPVPGGGAEPGGKGVEAVVGSGGLGTEGVADVSSDRGIGNGVEGRRVDGGGTDY